MKRAHVFIHGDVTGVGFRYWILKHAQKLGLTGWVRNLSRNTVEAIFEGSKNNVSEMVKLCHQGPEVSFVKKVEEKWEEALNEFNSFNIKK